MSFFLGVLESCKKYPHKEAVIWAGHTISYGKLDRASSELAQSMVQAGFKPGQRAAIYLEKSIASIVCMLATLKLQGIYVPLDRRQPDNRINYILQNCEISLIFAHQESKNSIAQLQLPSTVENIAWINSPVSSADFFHMETNHASQKAQPNHEDLVMLLYTSGSTGVPKGVKISQKNVQVFIDWCLQEFSLNSQDRFLNVAGFHFDLSIFDIYATLLVGGTLVIAPESTMPNPFQLCHIIETEKITVLYSVPSLLTLLITTGAIKKYPINSLRYVLFAGEVFPIKYLKIWKKTVPRAWFYNLYGPTETNVCSYFPVGDIPETQIDPVPIGVPVSGATLYALNEQGGTIQPGEIGELYVTGPCVTPGYWNYEDSKNSQNHRQNIHATGDLVTWESGNYLFHGRKDNQIKLKGYRIELDEIESVLANHQDVTECAVLLCQDERGPHLVAFLSGKKESLNSMELREYCVQYLPHYMIPQTFKICDLLPKNANGKIDKIQLGAVKK